MRIFLFIKYSTLFTCIIVHFIFYWKNAEIIRKKNFNTVPVINGTQGDAAIADLFKDKYSILYNSVPSSSEAMDYLHERIRHAVETQCDANAESSLHTHSVSTADVIKAVNLMDHGI